MAGPGIRLEPSTISRQHLHDLCATTSMSSDESDRIVVKSLEFNLKDEFDNDAPFPDNCFVRCKLSRLTYDLTNHHVDVNDFPLLNETLISGQEALGIDHLFSIPMTQYCHTFEKIQLHQSEKNYGGDGNIAIRFELWDKLQHVECRDVENYTLSFHFTIDGDRAARERQFQEELSPYLLQYSHLTAVLDTTKSEHNNIVTAKDLLRRTNDGFYLGEYLSTSQLTQEEVRRVLIIFHSSDSC